jgi:hypothetical protein
MSLYEQFEKEKGCKWIHNPVYFSQWIKPKVEKLERENEIMKETLQTFGYGLDDIENLFEEKRGR